MLKDIALLLMAATALPGCHVVQRRRKGGKESVQTIEFHHEVPGRQGR